MHGSVEIFFYVTECLRKFTSWSLPSTGQEGEEVGIVDVLLGA